MAKVKICGLTNLEDAKAAEELGADYLGFVFFSQSLRVVTADAVSAMVSRLKRKAHIVGLFHDQPIEFVKRAGELCSLDVLQLHGSESPEYVDELKDDYQIIKSFKIHKDFDFSVIEKYKGADFILFDTFKAGIPGGTGESFDWNIILGKRFSKPLFLAGGLNPGNARKAIALINPFSLDVASGVEKAPGVKDHKLIKEFIDAAR